MLVPGVIFVIDKIVTFRDHYYKIFFAVTDIVAPSVLNWANHSVNSITKKSIYGLLLVSADKSMELWPCHLLLQLYFDA